MQMFLQNLPLIILCLSFSAVFICALYNFINMPREDKIKALKEWLKWAVVMAEKELGSGTGQIKLREVYNMAIAQFPWLVRYVTFEQFSAYVDEALVWMREQIAKNQSIEKLVANV